MARASSCYWTQGPTRTLVAERESVQKSVGHQRREGIVENGKSQGQMPFFSLDERSFIARLADQNERKEQRRRKHEGWAGLGWTNLSRACVFFAQIREAYIILLLDYLRLDCVPVARALGWLWPWVLWSNVAHDTRNHHILSSFLPCLDLTSALPCFHCIPGLPRRTPAAKEIVWDSAPFPQPPVLGWIWIDWETSSMIA
ncbi:hypothetical protein LX32DRAFT_169358 [Colletotrichum zoysiae]|uniref:Uncharacterized protein n=1 Tax=Colletotrichum zoysiae TaxID=1216348 RepID=A0AAD9HR51_9PEZI|nr:hypothetical protein LX32DRAFT_169358 [Colletotrichum zoysiae]